MAGSAETANHLYPAQEAVRPHLGLVVDNSVALETIPLQAEQDDYHSPRHKGRVAIEALQAEYDAITELAELTDGQMRLPVEMTYDGHDLYGPDGRSATQAAENGYKKAREQAKENGNLWFEVGRRGTERGEVPEFVQKLQEASANTMIVTSDLPHALEDAEEDVGGYNIARQLALVRVITQLPNGKIMMYSQTLDGSNRQALEAIHTEFGFQAEPGELLAQRRFLNLSPDDQETVMDRITDTYDQEMQTQFGGQFYAGRTPADYRNTYDFVVQQRDLIETYKEAKLNGRLTDKFMYNLAASINNRFKTYKRQVEPAPALSRKVDKAPDRTRYIGYDHEAVYQELHREGRLARRAGKVFSGCGSTWKAESDDSTESLMNSLGYSTEAATKSWHGGKIFKNAKCVSCEKVKSEVGACHICKDCVDHPKGKIRTVQGRTGDPKKAPIRDKPAKVISLDQYRKAKEKKSEKVVENL